MTKLVQTLAIVLPSTSEAFILKRRAGARRELNLQQLFYATLTKPCPVALHSRIYLEDDALLPFFKAAHKTNADHVQQAVRQSIAVQEINEIGPGGTSEQGACDVRQVWDQQSDATLVENIAEHCELAIRSLANESSPLPFGVAIAEEACDATGISSCMAHAMWVWDISKVFASKQMRAGQDHDLDSFGSRVISDILLRKWLPLDDQADVHGLLSQPEWLVHRYTTGVGTLEGRIVLLLYRPPLHQKNVDYRNHIAREICITQVIPSCIKLWMHTLEVKLNGQVCVLCKVSLPKNDRPI